MGTPYLSEIRIMSFNFPPKGWALCNGQLMPINQNQALFSLLGTTYGGNGQQTFALPDLRSRVPLHMGSGFTLGQVGGQESHTLVSAEMAQHAHNVIGSSNTADQSNPSGKFWAVPGANTYATSASGGMAATLLTPTGGSQPHENMSPFLTLSFCIALQGIFPSRN